MAAGESTTMQIHNCLGLCVIILLHLSLHLLQIKEVRTTVKLQFIVIVFLRFNFLAGFFRGEIKKVQLSCN